MKKLLRVHASYLSALSPSTSFGKNPGSCHNGDMTRIRATAPGEYYHIFNRGFQKMPVFRDRADWMRMLFLILYCQSPLVITKITRAIGSALPTEGFSVYLETQEKIQTERFVELTCFALMPNHFHLLVKETEEDGISRYMQRIQLAYTHYFNAKYHGSGHIFQGRYRAVHVKDDRQLMHLSAYIHKNPRELSGWRGKEFGYPWSSLQDYTSANRWGGLLATDIIASRFAATPKSNYADFVRTSPAKMLEEEFGY